MNLRDAVLTDAPAIARIYGHYVRTSTFTFEEEAPPESEIAARMAAILAAGYPYIVADDGGVAGYAYAGVFRARSAYRFTVENSVYIAPENIGQGIGTALMRALIADCKTRGYRQMIAWIGDSQNDASIRLHRRLGFAPAGLMEGVGFKFGKWIDLIQMQLPLADDA